MLADPGWSKNFPQQLSKRAERVGVRLVPEQVQDFERYYQLLVRWNAKVNLTGLPLSPPADETIDRLFIEPLAAVPYFPVGGIAWVDIGSGNGSPALPIKLARVSARLTMVESRGRKAAFLREALRALMLRDASVDERRFELVATDPAKRNETDVVTIRGVAPAELMPGIIAILKPGGRVFFFRGRNHPEIATSRLRLIQTVNVADDSAIEIFERHG